MKLTCSRTDLLAACQLVSAAVPANTTIPALRNIKATAQDDALSLVAYDPTQGVGIRYRLPGVTVPRAGSCILPKDQLISILRESQTQDVALDAGEDAVIARCGGRYEMLSLNVNEFPDIPTFDDGGRYHEVAEGVLRGLVKRTVFAADKKDANAKFSTKAVLWEAEGTVVRLAATDTKRLSVCEGPATLHGEPDTGKASHLVPLKALGLLERILSDGAAPVRVGLRANDALFQTDRAMIYTSLVQGKFPPYRDIIAKVRKETTQGVVLPAAAFASRVRQAAIMTDEESRRVDMTFAGNTVTMTARGAKVGASEVILELPESVEKQVEIAFDPTYLGEFLKAVEGSPVVRLEMSTGTRAALFTCSPQVSYLVMPLTG